MAKLVAVLVLAALAAGCVDPEESADARCPAVVVTGGGAGDHSSGGQDADANETTSACPAPNDTRSGEAGDNTRGQSDA